jgi:hypothetical protein
MLRTRPSGKRARTKVVRVVPRFQEVRDVGEHRPGDVVVAQPQPGVIEIPQYETIAEYNMRTLIA